MLYILLFLLLLLLFICNFESRYNFICPAFIFCAVFCFNIVWAIYRAKDWKFEIGGITFCVIFFGILIFLVCCYIVKKFFAKVSTHNNFSCISYIYISRWKICVLIFFQSLTIFLTLYFIIVLYSSNWGQLSQAIWLYKYNYTSENGIFKSIPGYVAYMRTITDAMGYYTGYILINNRIISKKTDRLLFLSFVLSVLSGITTGSRGWALNLIIGAGVTFFLLKGKKEGRLLRLSPKLLFKIILIFVLLLISYQSIGTLLGADTSSIKFMDYISMYCGGSIYNLDYFIKNINWPKSNVFGGQTFIYIIKWIGPLFGIDTNYRLDMPFIRNGVYEMGNIYTTFYPFIYDFGLAGTFFLTALMAIITQSIYEKTKFSFESSKPAFSIILYSYVFSSIMFSFFSNKFYESVFTPNFLVYIISWKIIEIFFFRVTKNNRVNKTVNYVK